MQSTQVTPSLEQLRLELTNKDRWIRTAVGRHLVRVSPHDHRLLPSILDMSERYGLRANDELLRLAQELPLTEEIFQRLLKLLPSASGRWGQGIRLLICRAPAQLLLPVLSDILALGVWTERERERLENRREMASCNADEAWAELKDLASQDPDQDLSCRDQDLFDDLVLMLASSSKPQSESLSKLISSASEQPPLLIAAAIRILSLRGVRTSATDILKLIAHEDPNVAMEAAYGINRVADADVIPAILNLKSTAIPLLTAQAAAIEGWHNPLASTSLGQLAAEVRADLDDTVELWLAACAGFDPAQVQAALAVASKLDPDASEVFLAGELIPYLDLLGISTPERGRWLKIRRQEEDAILRGEESDWLSFGDEDDEKYAAEDEEDDDDEDRNN